MLIYIYMNLSKLMYTNISVVEYSGFSRCKYSFFLVLKIIMLYKFKQH